MRARTLIRSGVLAALLLRGAPAVAALWDEVQALRQDGAYGDATAWRRAQLRALSADLVRGAASGLVPDGSARRAEAAGLALRGGGDRVILASKAGAADGFYAVRLGAGTAPLVIGAPHPWADRGTAELACALFEQGRGRALLVATAHRDSASRGDLSGGTAGLGADVAHRPDSVFQAVTLGLADGLAGPLVVQIHGFGEGHGPWSAVVSAGAALQPPAVAEGARAALEPVLGRFGPLALAEDVPDLAGRNNAQSQALSGRARFLHLELSLAARSALASDPELLARFGEALAALAERRP